MAAYAKGEAPRDAEYAKGGGRLGRTRNFLKEHDEFRDPDHANTGADCDQMYAKSGAGKGTGCEGPLKDVSKGDKCLPTVKPRK